MTTCYELRVQNGETKKVQVRNFVRQGRTGQVVQGALLLQLFVLVSEKELHIRKMRKEKWNMEQSVMSLLNKKKTAPTSRGQHNEHLCNLN